jgi:UDP-N-acetylglucosamine pyrophosphorylase
MNPGDRDKRIEEKTQAAGVGQPTIQAFLRAVHIVAAGERGLIQESEIEPVASVPKLEEMAPTDGPGREQLERLTIIKLNGGLGTSMGLEKAKSLVPVKGEDTFLDFIARQVLHLRGGRRVPAFYLMDSFVTQKDTLAYLRKYPELSEEGQLDFLQNMVPKLDATTLVPIVWPRQQELEWCPPGHGDLYPALLGSGLLDRLLSRGIQFLFVSNSDNLGATVDPTIMRYFAESGLSFLMEVAVRTSADRKGGHLARSRATGRLLLRESAQCPKRDETAFQDIDRHRFFNTNNLWIRLDHLRAQLDHEGGTLRLPLITNAKTVDPKDAQSPKVLQLESAMGAAIECFEQTGALVVPRTRFAPVKTTADLLGLRSDAYRVTEDWRLQLDDARRGQPPVIDLDSKHYKVLEEFDRWFGHVPSLRNCTSLKIAGPVRFGPGVVCEGKVEFVNESGQPKTLEGGQYRDQEVTL